MRLVHLVFALLLSAPPVALTHGQTSNADELLVVHCLLPGQVRQLGARTTYVSPRKPVRTTALDCRVRGGEYVLQGRANLKSALNVWLNAAEQGDAEAQVTLGEVFEQGLGVPPDYEAARFWYEQAATQGSPRAMTNLGNLFERGLGVTPDSRRAVQWYRRAAGLPDELPVMLEHTVDVAPVDSVLLKERADLQSAIAALEAEARQLRRDLEVSTRLLERVGTEARQAADLAREQGRSEGREENERQSSVEATALQAEYQRIIAGFQDSLVDRDIQIDMLNQTLASLKNEQADAQILEAQLRQLQKQLAEQQQRLQTSQQALSVSSETELGLRDTIAQQLDALAGHDQRAQVQVDKIETLLAQIAQLQANREAPQVAQPVAQQIVAGPSISLVDPILPSTRGLVKVSMPKVAGGAAAKRQIVGRVSAPAGLLTLSVNDTPVQPNAAGIFTHLMDVVSSTASVVITAIDQQGKRADLRFDMVRNTSSAAEAPAVGTNLDLGRFHALLIGNSRYHHLPQLQTPKNDVDRLESLLRERYGFNVDVLLDANRYEILSALNELRSKLTPQDNLLIYYAGHGELDRANMRGHWLPVDAEPSNTANWVSNVAITDVLNVIRAHQIMLVVDSCYSGTLTRSSLSQLDTGMTEQERRTWLELLAEKKARVVLTSGGLSPVLDIGGGAHSVFASAFLTVLENNVELMTGRSLYQAVAARVAHAAAEYEFEQIPAYAPIARSGHEAGDFLLLPTRIN